MTGTPVGGCCQMNDLIISVHVGGIVVVLKMILLSHDYTCVEIECVL